jgi:DNA-binding MarR family transcriptional regulator
VSELDPLIHAPRRLRIMATLDAADTVELAHLRNRMELSASDLSKQMSAVADAGYVRVRKTGKGPGSATWYSLTKPGRRAYRDHIAALRALIDAPVREET